MNAKALSRAFPAVLGLLFGLLALLPGIAAPDARAELSIVIGSKKFTESYILSDIANTLLERAGFKVTHKEGMGGTSILWQALLSGHIAAYP